MANTINANTIYIDTAATVTAYKIRISQIILTPTSANAVLVLQDDSTSSVKLDLRAATAGQSLILDLTASPMLFESGLKVSTLTNANATILYNRG